MEKLLDDREGCLAFKWILPLISLNLTRFPPRYGKRLRAINKHDSSRRATELDRALKPNIQWKLARVSLSCIDYDVVRTNKFAKRRLACASESPRTGKQSVESFTTARLRLSSGIKGNDVVRDVIMGGEHVFQLELIIESYRSDELIQQNF